MCGSEGPRWGWGHHAPGPTLLLSVLVSAAPLGLLGEETRQVRGGRVAASGNAALGCTERQGWRGLPGPLDRIVEEGGGSPSSGDPCRSGVTQAGLFLTPRPCALICPPGSGQLVALPTSAPSRFPSFHRGSCLSPSFPSCFALCLFPDAVPLTLHDPVFQVSLEVIPNRLGPPQNLLHIRAVGTSSTLHYVWGTTGPPAALLVATSTPHSTLAVNWSLLLSPEPDGGLTVLPTDSIRFSSALVFTRVRRLGEEQRVPDPREGLKTVKSGSLRVGGGASGGGWLWGQLDSASPVPPHPTRQLFEFDSTNTSEVSAKPPGKPYAPYSLAEFSWNNISDFLDPATLSATFRGHPIHDPTGAFANGSLAFRVRCREPEELRKLVYAGGDGLRTRTGPASHASPASPTPGAGLPQLRPTGPSPAPPAFGGHLPARGGPAWGPSSGKPLRVWAGGSHLGPGPRLPLHAGAALHRR